MERETTLVPLDRPVADIMAVAKRDLQPGEKLDEFGGYTFYGLMDRAEEVRKENALPVGLAIGAEIISKVKDGEIITWEDVKINENSTVVKLRRQQDELIERAS